MNILGIVAVVFFAAYAWLTFSIAYHFIRFGVGPAPKTFAFVFFIGSFILLGFVVFAYLNINWSEIVIPKININR